MLSYWGSIQELSLRTKAFSVHDFNHLPRLRAEPAQKERDEAELAGQVPLVRKAITEEGHRD